MKNQLYMLDTNTVSYIIKGKPVVVKEYLLNVPMSSVCVSAITKAELLRGVARKPDAIHLPLAVKEFLLHIEVLSWDSMVAEAYAHLRTACESSGKTLSAMDMLIAAHSVAVGAILVTSDKAFYQLEQYLTLQDWTQPFKR